MRCPSLWMWWTADRDDREAGGFRVSRLKRSSCRGLKEPGCECVTLPHKQHQHRHTYRQSQSPSRDPRHRKNHLWLSLRHRRAETTSAPVGETERGKCKWQRLELFVTEGRAVHQFIRKRNHFGRLPHHTDMHAAVWEEVQAALCWTG